MSQFLASFPGRCNHVDERGFDFGLTKSDPLDVVRTIEISRAALRKMHQNLFWAVAYNVVAFPLAAGVLYPTLLRPELAALARSGSTECVFPAIVNGHSTRW